MPTDERGPALRIAKLGLIILGGATALSAAAACFDDASASTASSTGDAGIAGDASAPIDGGDAGDLNDAGVTTDEAGTQLTGDRVELAGCIPFYTAETTLGGTQKLALVVDTGSSTIGVAAEGCAGCAGVSPLYTPGPTAKDQSMVGEEKYGDGSLGWSGEIYEDSLELAKQSASMRFVAIQTQANFFGSYNCKSHVNAWQGVLGMGPSAILASGTDSFMDQLVAQRGVHDVFAVELCDEGGNLWIGGYDPGFVTAPPVYTPMIDGGLYGAVVSDIRIAGKSIGVASSAYPPTIFDTGGPFFFLPQSLFKKVVGGIEADPAFQAALKAKPGWFAGNDASCTAVAVTRDVLDATLPPLSVSFGTEPQVTIHAKATESYLVPFQGQDGETYWCPGIVEEPADGVVLDIGGALLRANITIFDREHQRIGFAPHKPCP